LVAPRFAPSFEATARKKAYLDAEIISGNDI
jgi:hypothetical protein